MIWSVKTPGMALPGQGTSRCAATIITHGGIWLVFVEPFARIKGQICAVVFHIFSGSVAYSDLRFTAPKQRSIQRHISISLSDTKPSLPERRYPVQPTSQLSSQPTTRASNGSALKVRGNLSDDGVHNDVMRTKRRRILRVRGRFNTPVIALFTCFFCCFRQQIYNPENANFRCTYKQAKVWPRLILAPERGEFQGREMT